MPEYGDMDTKIAGLIYGLDPKFFESWRAAEDIDYGAPVFSYEGEDFSNGEGSVWNVKQDTSTITLDADLVTSNVITTTLTIDGVAQTPVATTFITSHNDTMDAHKAALEAAFPDLVVTLTDLPTPNRVFELFYKGSNLNLVTSVVTLGASQAGTTITYTTAQVFIGMSSITHKSHVNSVGYYEAEEVINVLTKGLIYVSASLAVDANTDAYVIWSLTNQGKFTNVATDNYATNVKFRETITAAGLVLVEVRGQNTDATP